MTANADARAAAEAAARQSYGRLLASLARRFRNIALAEDALADAFARALADWPGHGVPANPDAWLMAAAKRRAIDSWRQQAVHQAAEPELNRIAEELDIMSKEGRTVPDERLALMLACAHPAIDRSLHAPLMLQCVLGLTAGDIASAFLVAPATMGQRLSRAKARIAALGLSFTLPESDDLVSRLEPVLAAIYAAYGKAWSEPGAATGPENLGDEAIWLARVVAGLLPDEPEALGLLALLLFLDSRRKARRDKAGCYVPLVDQDCGLWNGAQIIEAETLLRRASSFGGLGRYELESAIQAVHAARRLTGATDWTAILALYDALLALTQSPVVAINRAMALAEIKTPAAALASLPAASEHDWLERYQPYHAARADLCARKGDLAEAREAYSLAIGLESDPAVRAFLAERQHVLAH